MKAKKDDLRPEYPVELIRSGVRGKYARADRQGAHVVTIDADLHDRFPDSEAVNRALRKFLQLKQRKTRRQYEGPR